MKRIILALGMLAMYAAPVMAQNTTVKVVGTCGTATDYLAGRAGPPTVDTSGNLCIGGTISSTASIAAFAPTTQAALAVTDVTGNVALPGGATMVLCNTGSNIIYYKFGIGAGTTAATTDIKLPSGMCIADAVGSNTYVAAITAASTSTLDISGGSGLPAFGSVPPTAGTATNITGVNGVTPLTGTGASGTGALRVAVSTDSTYTVAATESGTWTVQPGNTANTTPWLMSPSTGGNTAAVKAASTAAGATDPALVVAISPNNTIAATQSGTWNVGSVTTLPALVAGTAVIGKTGIDQTTPGTTNLVATSSDAAIAPGTAPAKAGVTAGVYNSTPPTLTNGQTAATQIDSDGSAYNNVRDWTVSGSTPVHYLSAASTNATNIKASAGTLHSITAINTTATIYYLKLYDKATAPTCGTDTPVHTLPVPASATAAGLTVNPFLGLNFANGIGFCLVGGIADNDTANAATGVAINVGYK